MTTPRPYRVVLLDNYDSFAYNLFQAVGQLTGSRALVYRNDRVTVGALAAIEPTHIIISPGPGRPEDPNYFGVCQRVIVELGPRVPILGVCLGHQGIAAAFGGRIAPAPRIMHGKTSIVAHDGQGLFADLPSPMTVMRYHSLTVDEASLPTTLEISSRTDDGVIMGLRHRTHPITGVQFHPESIGTPHGLRLLDNFLSL